jgi:hypothetical protein
MALPIYTPSGALPPSINQDGFHGLLGNPLFQIGMGILGNNYGNFGKAGPALSRGVAQGFQNVQQAQFLQQRQQLNDLQMKEYKRKDASDTALSEAVANAYTPATSAPNMSFMDANNAAMAGETPDYQWEQKPASFDQQGMLNNILQNPDIAGSEKLAHMKSFEKANQPMVLKGGDVVVDPKTLKPIFTAPEPPQYQFAPNGQPVDMNNLDLSQSYRSAPEGMEWQNGQLVSLPGYVNMKSQIAAAGRPSVSVTTKQEGEESKAVGKYFGEQYADIQKAGLGASGKINRVQRLNQLLDGVSTGKFTPLGVELASAAQSLGFNIDPKLGNKQAAEALSNEMALELRNPSGGAGMPGAMSDSDREFLKKIVPGIEKTPEGRKLISESMMALAKRDQQVAKLARDYRKKHGTLDEGFYDELLNFSQENPLFTGAEAGAVRFNPKWTARDLKKGQSYLMPNGQKMVWNGLEFN